MENAKTDIINIKNANGTISRDICRLLTSDRFLLLLSKDINCTYSVRVPDEDMKPVFSVCSIDYSTSEQIIKSYLRKIDQLKISFDNENQLLLLTDLVMTLSQLNQKYDLSFKYGQGRNKICIMMFSIEFKEPQGSSAAGRSRRQSTNAHVLADQPATMKTIIDGDTGIKLAELKDKIFKKCQEQYAIIYNQANAVINMLIAEKDQCKTAFDALTFQSDNPDKKEKLKEIKTRLSYIYNIINVLISFIKDKIVIRNILKDIIKEILKASRFKWNRLSVEFIGTTEANNENAVFYTNIIKKFASKYYDAGSIDKIYSDMARHSLEIQAYVENLMYTDETQPESLEGGREQGLSRARAEKRAEAAAAEKVARPREARKKGAAAVREAGREMAVKAARVAASWAAQLEVEDAAGEAARGDCYKHLMVSHNVTVLEANYVFCRAIQEQSASVGEKNLIFSDLENTPKIIEYTQNLTNVLSSRPLQTPSGDSPMPDSPGGGYGNKSGKKKTRKKKTNRKSFNNFRKQSKKNKLKIKNKSKKILKKIKQKTKKLFKNMKKK